MYSLIKFKLWTSALEIVTGHEEAHNCGSPQHIVAQWTIGAGALLEDGLNVRIELDHFRLLTPFRRHVAAYNFRHDCCSRGGGGKRPSAVLRDINREINSITYHNRVCRIYFSRVAWPEFYIFHTAALQNYDKF